MESPAGPDHALSLLVDCTKAHSRNGRAEAVAPAGGLAHGPQLLLGAREAESLTAGLGLGKEGREESTRARRMEKWAPRETLREL